MQAPSLPKSTCITILWTHSTYFWSYKQSLLVNFTYQQLCWEYRQSPPKVVWSGAIWIGVTPGFDGLMVYHKHLQGSPDNFAIKLKLLDLVQYSQVWFFQKGMWSASQQHDWVSFKILTRSWEPGLVPQVTLHSSLLTPVSRANLEHCLCRLTFSNAPTFSYLSPYLLHHGRSQSLL